MSASWSCPQHQPEKASAVSLTTSIGFLHHRGPALAVLTLIASVLAPPVADADYAPRVAIVMCEDTYDADWLQAQMGAQSFVGIAGLVGVPYDTFTVDELLAADLSTYTSIWIGRCTFVAPERYDTLLSTLSNFLAQGGSVLMDGPVGSFYQDPDGATVWRGTAALEAALNVSNPDWYSIEGYTIRMTTAPHPVHTIFGLAPGTTLTQGIAFGTGVMDIADDGAPGSATLLELVSPDQTVTYPYLSTTEVSGGKVMVISGYATWTGAATVFRSYEPAGFYDNMLLPYLLDAIQWLIAPDGPVAGLQISHAAMTAIARLDADEPDRHEAQEAALTYLSNMAERTGVATAFGIVTELANTAGTWSTYRQFGEQLEALGGLIGSHSHTHNNNMSVNLTEAEFIAEVGPSHAIVEAELASIRHVTPPRLFINPGMTIRNEHYSLVFAASDIYMTHGYETAVNYASGIMGWGLDEDVEPKPVLFNAPASDFQWLYLADPDWTFTPQEAANIQTMILEYFRDRLKRGAIYHEMFHDYGLAEDPPVHFPDQSPMPLYDANLQFFEDNDIYAPSIEELALKLHAAKKAGISSAYHGSSGELTVALDLTELSPTEGEALAGMGLRVARMPTPIESVSIDGAPYFAFTDNTVILPSTSPPGMEVTIAFGDGGAGPVPRLTFISKPFSSLTANVHGASLDLVRPAETTKLCFLADPEFVVLGAGVQERRQADELCAQTTHSSGQRKIRLRRLANSHGVYLLATDRLLAYGKTSEGNLTLLLGGGDEAGTVEFAAQEEPTEVRIDGSDAPTTPTPDGFSVSVPPGLPAVLEIVYDTTPSPQALKPKTLLIYYAWPSVINGASSVAGATAEFGQYDYVVLGDGLQEPDHPDHQNTAEIIRGVQSLGTFVLGYIPIGTVNPNLSMEEIERRVDRWNDIGADGILLDQFGYDYQTSRLRQNTVVDYVHSQGMLVAANALYPEDVFDSDAHPVFNPSGAPTHLNLLDYYLYEGHQIDLDDYEEVAAWQPKANALASYQQAIGFKILSVTTTNMDDPAAYDEDKFFYAWHSALMYGHAATGWGEFGYSAAGASNAQAPFRVRPSVDPGAVFTGPVVDASPVFTRQMNLGVVFVDTSTHTAGFIRADCNADLQVDFVDFLCFADCMAGLAAGLAPDCGIFDSNMDDDVDLPDFAEFQRIAFAGE